CQSVLWRVAEIVDEISSSEYAIDHRLSRLRWKPQEPSSFSLPPQACRCVARMISDDHLNSNITRTLFVFHPRYQGTPPSCEVAGICARMGAFPAALWHNSAGSASTHLC